MPLDEGPERGDGKSELDEAEIPFLQILSCVSVIEKLGLLIGLYLLRAPQGLVYGDITARGLEMTRPPVIQSLMKTF